MIDKNFYYNERFRNFLYQFLIVLFIFFVVFYLTSNLLYNLEKRGIRTGFDFLSSTAGFGVLFSLIDYNEADSYGRTFFVGLANTVLVSLLGIFIASVLGLFVGIGRLSKNWLMQKVCVVYVEVFRNIPILLQIVLWNTIFRKVLPVKDVEIFPNFYIGIKQITFSEITFTDFSYFFLIGLILVVLGLFLLNRWSNKRLDQTGKTFPVLLVSALIVGGVLLASYILSDVIFDFVSPVQGRFGFDKGTVIISELFSLALALGVYTATYISEAVRSGIQAISKGQMEAAESLGLRSFTIIQKIILPQAMRVIIPPTTNQFVNLIKNSSLATAIGYPDLVNVFAGTTLNQVGQAIEIMFITMLVYLFLSIVVSVLMNWYDSRSKLIER